MITRRQLLAATLGSLCAATISAHGQAPRLRRVVWLAAADKDAAEGYLEALRAGLGERGYREGQNYILETYWANFSRSAADMLATNIVASKPAVIVGQGYAVIALHNATKTVPLVVGSSGNVVKAGLAASLGRPGGNVTGIQFQRPELVAKRIELLKELKPDLSRVAVISQPEHAGESEERVAALIAVERLGLYTEYFAVHHPSALQPALEAARAKGAQALVFFPDGISFPKRKIIAAFGLKYRLLTASGWDQYADAGLLMTYGPNIIQSYKRLAYFVDRILKGVKPADLPIELPAIDEMIINLKTAKAIDLAIPQSILLRAGRVIE